jgi:hypothetical protein
MMKLDTPEVLILFNFQSVLVSVRVIFYNIQYKRVVNPF